MITCPHCKEDIEEVSAENFSIYNASVGLLLFKCPHCNKTHRLNGAKSKEMLEKFPELEKEIEQGKVEMESERLGSSVLGDFEEKFRDALGVFGLNTKKMEPKINAILKYLERSGASRDWLKYYMQRLSFTNRPTIDSIVDFVFIDEGNDPNIPAPGSGNQAAGGYTIQQLPGGHLVLVPPTPQFPTMGTGQPIIIDRGGGGDGGRTVARESENDMVIEELDGDGKVTKRITKGMAARAAGGDQVDQTSKTLQLLKDMGLLKSMNPVDEGSRARLPNEVKDTLDDLKEAVARLSVAVAGKPAKEENEEIKSLNSRISQLTEKLNSKDEETRKKEMDGIRGEVSEIKGLVAEIRNRPAESAVSSGLHGDDLKTHTEHENLETITGSGEKFVDKIARPLEKILDNQTKLNSLLLVRDMEKQDGVAPGTYLKAMQPVTVFSDAEVGSTVDKWKKRAAETPVVKKEGAAS